jgi:adenosine deaminase CECR1
MIFKFIAIVFIFSHISTVPQAASGFQHHHLFKKHSLNLRNSKATMARPSFDDYLRQRTELIDSQLNRSLGFDIVLTEKEQIANEIVMNLKMNEYNLGFQNPRSFLPSRHYFEVIKQIEATDLFKIIKKMPKGAILHAHDMALVSTDYLVSLTYRENLWQCSNKSNMVQIKHLLFSLNTPELPVENCEWKLVSAARAEVGRIIYDSEIRKLFTLYTPDPVKTYKDINAVWRKFDSIFEIISTFITYEPVWKDYFRQALKEFYEDDVQYLEFRGVLPDVYNLEGKQFTKSEIVGMYKQIAHEFKEEHPDFIGVKFIYAPIKFVDDAGFLVYMKDLQTLLNDFPSFVAGFDLVGQEDLGRPLIEFAAGLLKLPEDVQFFFHAGETNWYGTKSDENLLDAILLGTKRIGHGFALVKHPELLELVKSRNIAIEVNPLSNQVLKLVDDFRNHPCSILFSDNYNVVISSDDPSFWEATPLSHDFYQAFLGMASQRQDLRLLKKLALNSLNASAMNDADKVVAISKWTAKWNTFIDELVAGTFKNDV